MALYRVLLGAWIVICLGCLAFAWMAIRRVDAGQSHSEVEGIVTVVGIACACLTLVPILGYIFILRGVRQAGIVVGVSCLLPLPPLIHSTYSTFGEPGPLVLQAVAFAFLALNIGCGFRAARRPLEDLRREVGHSPPLAGAGSVAPKTATKHREREEEGAGGGG